MASSRSGIETHNAIKVISQKLISTLIRDYFEKKEYIVIILLILLNCLPIWIPQYFPSQDGPSHLNNSNILLNTITSECPLFNEYYLINNFPVPNLTTHLILCGLMYFVPYLVAEKILLCGYIILFPLSMRYAFLAINPDNLFVSYIAFPLIYNVFHHKGFYNFCYSLILYFFIVGVWVNYQKYFLRKYLLLTLLLSIALYFSHILTTMLALLLIGISTLWMVAIDWLRQCNTKQFENGRLWTIVNRRALLPFLTLLPTIILTVLFTLHQIKGDFYYTTFSDKIILLLSCAPLISYNKMELFFMGLLPFFLIILLIIAIKNREREPISPWNNVFLLVFLSYIFIYFLMPEASSQGGGVIGVRVIFFIYCASLFLIVSQQQIIINKNIFKIIMVVINICAIIFFTTRYIQFDDYLKEYLSGANNISRGKTILCLNFSIHGRAEDGTQLSCKVAPFLHASGYLAAEKCLINCDNYEANENYFPIIYRPDRNPYKIIGNLEILTRKDLMNEIQILNDDRQINMPVDYILIWDYRKDLDKSQTSKSIFNQIKDGYELIFTSKKRGLMKLYRRRDLKNSTR